MNKENINISVIGMGYVGLPLANELAKYFNVVGFDNNKKKIDNLKKSFDTNKELKKIRKNNLKKHCAI